MGDLRPGERLGEYEVIEELAAGGMGRIYKARQPGLERIVAIKVISGPQAHDEAFRNRFRREALHIAAVDHPNVIPIFGVGETSEGEPYLVMRFVDGTDLAAKVAKDGSLAPDLAVLIVGQLARALDASHARGLVHRDVKPANVLLSGSGDQVHAYLTDFGLTKQLGTHTELTQSGEWYGTAGFAAPEQVEGGEVTPAADVYALGCVLYFCLAGEQPFTGPPAQVMWSHLHSDIPRLPSSVPNAESLDRVIARATAKGPGERWNRAGDLAAAAASALAGVETPTERLGAVSVPEPTEPIRERAPAEPTAVLRTRRPWPWFAGIAALLILAGIGAAFALGAFDGGESTAPEQATGDTVTATTPEDTEAESGSASGDEPSFVETSLDPQSGATAELPRGRRSLENFGERRSRTQIDLSNGAVVVVDYTPQDTPNPGSSFSATGKTVTNSALGVTAGEYVARDCEEGPVCIDYPLDLGGYGFGVLGAATTRREARLLARTAATTLEAPSSTVASPDFVEDCVSEFEPNVSDMSVRNMACAEADGLTAAVINDLQPGAFTSAGFSCEILGDYGPKDGSPILGASDIRCEQDDRAFRFSWGD